MKEESIVQRLTAEVSEGGRALALQFADDAALLSCAASETLVVSQDMLVENVDFTLATFTPEDIGYKALAVNLSDLAAMGATPYAYLQGLALPKALAGSWMEGFASEQALLARRFGLELVGGDLSSIEGPLVISITICGRVVRGHALQRQKAQVFDRLLVGGFLGAAAAGLAVIRGRLEGEFPQLARAQRRPLPQIALGRWLTQAAGCHGAMDLSDGLGSDLPRFLPVGLGASIEVERLPLSTEVTALAARLGVEPHAWALGGGEDFVLLTAVAAEAAEGLIKKAGDQGFVLHDIGRVEPVSGLRLIDKQGRAVGWPAGFDHFE